MKILGKSIRRKRADMDYVIICTSTSDLRYALIIDLWIFSFPNVESPS